MTKKKSDHAAPAGLSAASRRWWTATVSDYELEPHHLRLLEAAGRAWDRAEEARRIVDKEGCCVADRFGVPRAHPATAIERDQRQLFARLVRELGLDVAGPENRPPRIGSQG